jgi:putative lipoprotein
MPEVSGTIVFGADLEPFTGATVYVRLEDVSLMDIAAPTVAETILRDVRAGGQAPTQLEFTVAAPPLEPKVRYNVRVHVDVDADGQVSIGDYVSTISHSVKAGVEAARLLIPVTRVS